MPDARLIQFARQMRKQPTDAERRIWACLRSKQLSGYRFCRQHPIGGYIADFYCHQARLVIELDGGQHADPHAQAYDQRRSAALEAHGVAVIRFSDCDALKNSHAVAMTILREVEQRIQQLGHSIGQTAPTQPSPGVPGEG